MRSNWGSGRGGSPFTFNWRDVPVTRALIIASVVTFLAYFFGGQGDGLVSTWIPFRSQPPLWFTHPWTWFTYAFLDIPGDFLSLVFYIWSLFILYWAGGTLERSWSSRNYAVLFFGFTAIGALAFVIPVYVMHKAMILEGLALPINALIAAWAALDPEQEISFWGVPMRAKYVALTVVLVIYFQFGLAFHDPIVALFTAASPAAAWFYVRKLPRLNLSFRPPRPQRQPLLRETPEAREQVRGSNPLRRRQEQKEIERLRKLLGEDGDDYPARRN